MTLADQFFSVQLNQYVAQHSEQEDPLLKELREYTKKHTNFAQMLSGPVEGALLRLLVALTAPQRCLEIGMFTGYSALQIASALGEQAKLICLETRRQYAEIAKSFFGRSEHGSKIEVVLGNAHETVKNQSGPFELVFCDADKTAYCDYYEEVIPKITPGGLFIADNALWGGSVLTCNDKDALAINKFNQLVSQDPQVDSVLLTVRDGIMIARKK